MNVKIISWNVRGLNVQDKRLRVRNLIRKWGPNVVIRSLWGNQHVDWSYLGSWGASGVVLVM